MQLIISIVINLININIIINNEIGTKRRVLNFPEGLICYIFHFFVAGESQKDLAIVYIATSIFVFFSFCVGLWIYLRIFNLHFQHEIVEALYHPLNPTYVHPMCIEQVLIFAY